MEQRTRATRNINPGDPIMSFSGLLSNSMSLSFIVFTLLFDISGPYVLFLSMPMCIHYYSIHHIDIICWTREIHDGSKRCMDV